jgi:hypothetical protein
MLQGVDFRDFIRDIRWGQYIACGIVGKFSIREIPM